MRDLEGRHRVLAPRDADVASVLAFDDVRGDEYRFAVAVSPYSVRGMVAAHYALLGVAEPARRWGPSFYYAWERPHCVPSIAAVGGVRIKDTEWFGAHRREASAWRQPEKRTSEARQDEIRPSPRVPRRTAHGRAAPSPSRPRAGRGFSGS